jgi:hypothetical protein
LGNVSGVSIDYVWPGDVNYDGVVNMQDLMILGVTAGATGPVREDQSIDWYPHYVTDWADTVVTGVNFKHADTDGNGFVEILDTLAIVVNYDSTHNYISFKSSQFSENDLFVIPEEALLTDEKKIEIPVYLGTEDKTIEDIYGLFFQMFIDGDVIVENSIQLNLENSWLGIESDNIWALSKSFDNTGFADFGITRSNHQPVSGYGQLGLLSFELDEELPPGNSIAFDLNFTNLHGHNYDLQPIDLATSSFLITLNNYITGSENDYFTSQVRVYPNPSSNGETIYFYSPESIQSIEIFKLDGKPVHQVHFSDRPQIYQLKNFNRKGIYLVRLQTENYSVNKRIVIK